jgi:hypothetical protein
MAGGVYDSENLNRYNNTSPKKKNFKFMYSSKNVSGVFLLKYF